MTRQLSKEESQEQLSTFISLITIGSLIIPGLLIWATSKLHIVTTWLLERGILERSERVIWQLNDGTGLDLGRILMLTGISLLLALLTTWILKPMMKTKTPEPTQQTP